MATPTLSILVPCYNSERHVAETISNILSQLHADMELICYDDGSIDGTLDILCDYDDERMTVIDGQRNAGISHARNQLLAAAQGEYVWFIDSDDLLFPGSIAEISAILSRVQPDTLSFNFRRIGSRRYDKAHTIESDTDHTTFIGPADQILHDPRLIVSGTVVSFNMHPWSRIFKRQLFDEMTQFPIGRVFEDVEVIPLILYRSRKHYHWPKAVIQYRQHDNSILGEMSTEKLLGLMEAWMRMRMRFEEQYGPMPHQIRDAHIKICARSLRICMRQIDKRAPPEIQTALRAQLYKTFMLAHGMPLRAFLCNCLRRIGIINTVHTLKRIMIGRRATARQ